jgi:hypothetical protein
MMLDIVCLEEYDNDGNRPAWDAIFPEGNGTGEIGQLWSETAVTIVAIPRRAGMKKHTFHLCRCIEEVDEMFSGRAPKKIPCTFIVLPDLSQEDPRNAFDTEEDYTPPES